MPTPEETLAALMSEHQKQMAAIGKQAIEETATGSRKLFEIVTEQAALPSRIKALREKLGIPDPEASSQSETPPTT